MALHEELMEACADLRGCEARVMGLLARMASTRGYLALGCTSLISYAEDRLQLPVSTARAKVLLADRLTHLPRLREQVESGELGWTKARTVAQVATAETDEEWTRAALTHPTRALEKTVQACAPGEPPPDPDGEPEPEPESLRLQLRFRVRAADAQLLRQAMALLRVRVGDELGTTDIEEGVLLAELARGALMTQEAKGQRIPEERFRVVLQRCPECDETRHVSGDSEAGHRVSPELVEEACCCAEVVDLSGDPETRGRLRRTVPPRVRREVYHRDRYRCAIEGCGNRLWSDLHHLQPVAAGGLAGGSVSRVSNLIVACGVRRRAIHQRAIHQGALHVERSADGALTTRWPAFELPTVKTWGLALEVMSAHPLHTSEVYRLIDHPREGELRAQLNWLEQRGWVVRQADGRWFGTATRWEFGDSLHDCAPFLAPEGVLEVRPAVGPP